MSEKYKIHMIDKKSGQMLYINYVQLIPRKGDVVRLPHKDYPEGAYYKVTDVYWCYDEDNKNRVNLGLTKVK